MSLEGVKHCRNVHEMLDGCEFEGSYRGKRSEYIGPEAHVQHPPSTSIYSSCVKDPNHALMHCRSLMHQRNSSRSVH